MIERLQKRRNEEGFTLVELLVVIVILGILAAIVVFAVGGITDKGDASASATDKSVLETAEESYYARSNTNAYTTESGLVTAQFLRAASTKWDVCVSTAAHASGVNKVYELVGQGAACPAPVAHWTK